MISTQVRRGRASFLRFNRTVALVATFVAVAGATPVYADSPSKPDSANGRNNPKTVVIDGREYGPKDGLKVDTYEFEIVPGSGPVGIVFEDTPKGPGSITPQITWGASYAISTEWWSQLGYDGKARAMANIFGGKRYIQVCFWYTRAGEGNVSGTYCSNATSNGAAWSAGPEVTAAVWDSFNPIAPPTIFNFSVVKIDPGIF